MIASGSLSRLLCAALVAGCSEGTGPKSSAPTTWTSLTAGGSHTCGLRSGGAAYCWGSDSLGELGDGLPRHGWRTTPGAVAGGLTFASLTAGGFGTCGVTSSGAAYCWSAANALGDGSTTNRTTPGAVAGGLTFAAVSTQGSYACGVTSGGAAYCWGYNLFGQLGDGSSVLANFRLTPAAVVGGLTFASLTTGGSHTCGLTSGGAAYCWGDNSSGQLGTDTVIGPCSVITGYSFPCSTTPVAVAGGLTFASLTAGGSNTCGLTSAGAAYCWGDDFWGQLGDGSSGLGNIRLTPVAVANP